MNKFQKARHREVKAMLKADKDFSYKEARKIWNFLYKLFLYAACEDCDNVNCKQRKNKIIYCNERR